MCRKSLRLRLLNHNSPLFFCFLSRKERQVQSITEDIHRQNYPSCCVWHQCVHIKRLQENCCFNLRTDYGDEEGETDGGVEEFGEITLGKSTGHQKLYEEDCDSAVLKTLKKTLMIRNLQFHLSQATSSQNSNFDNTLDQICHLVHYQPSYTQ